MAKTAELDKDLVDGLKAAKSKRAYFALVLKGSNDGALIVSKTKVPPAAIADAKKKSGGSAVLKGFCQYEEGTYVFETAKQAPATAAQAVKVIAKRDAGLAVKAEFRVSTDPELLGDEGGAAATAPSKAPPAPPLSGDAVIKRFHAMTADIQASLGGPNDARVKVLFAAIRDQLAKKDFAGASKNIDELAVLIKPVKATEAPKVDGTAVIKRLHAMTADIQASLGGPNAARVKALFAAIRDQLAKKDFAAATKNIDELEPLVKPGNAAAAPPLSGAELTKRLNAMTPEIKTALAGPTKAQVQQHFVAATGQIKNKDFAAAAKSLDELERWINQGRGDGPMPKAASKTPEIPTGIVKKRQYMLTRWKQIPKEIAPDLESLMKTIAVQHPEITNLPQLRAVIDRQLTALYDELQNEIDGAINKGDSTVLKGLRERVLKHKFVNHLMSNPYVSGSRFQSTILNAIQEMEQNLAS